MDVVSKPVLIQSCQLSQLRRETYNILVDPTIVRQISRFIFVSAPAHYVKYNYTITNLCVDFRERRQD